MAPGDWDELLVVCDASSDFSREKDDDENETRVIQPQRHFVDSRASELVLQIRDAFSDNFTIRPVLAIRC
jgi:hypothetical protein